MYVCVNVYVSVYVAYVHIFVCVYILTCMHLCEYICTDYVFMNVCLYVWHYITIKLRVSECGVSSDFVRIFMHFGLL